MYCRIYPGAIPSELLAPKEEPIKIRKRKLNVKKPKPSASLEDIATKIVHAHRLVSKYKKKCKRLQKQYTKLKAEYNSIPWPNLQLVLSQKIEKLSKCNPQTNYLLLIVGSKLEFLNGSVKTALPSLTCLKLPQISITYQYNVYCLTGDPVDILNNNCCGFDDNDRWKFGKCLVYLIEFMEAKTNLKRCYE